MKRKSLIAIMATLMLFVVTVSAFAACNKGGKHNFSEEWSNNESHHWHACADKGCKETKDKAEHSWDGGNVTVEPTTEKEGVMVYTCTVCRREKTGKIDKLVAEKEYTINLRQQRRQRGTTRQGKRRRGDYCSRGSHQRRICFCRLV